MFKHTVEYRDFNDKKIVEDLYFHMMAPEFADLEFNPTFKEEGGMSDYIKQAMSSGEGQKVYTFFKLMIVNSYGRRSEDGSEFVKKPEFTEKFLNSRAYEEFFMWLVMNPKNAETFFNSLIPEKLLKEVEGVEQNSKKSIQDMSREELQALYLAKIEGKSASE